MRRKSKKNWDSTYRGLKKQLHNVLSFLTSTRIFLAFNGMLVYAFTSLLYGVTPRPLLLQAAFMITLAVYTLNIYTDTSEDEINRGESQIERECFLGISLFSIIIAMTIGILFGLKTLIVISIPIITGFIYSVKILPNLPRLKEVLGGKSLTVAFTWALTGTLLPQTHPQTNIKVPMLIFIYIFVLLLVNTILFDMLDIEGDSKSGITTIPLFFGKEKTAKLLLILNTFLLIWLVYAILNGFFTRYIPGLLFGSTYSYLLIWVFGWRKNQRILHEVFIDGEWIPIVSVLLLMK